LRRPRLLPSETFCASYVSSPPMDMRCGRCSRKRRNLRESQSKVNGFHVAQ